MHLTPFSCCFRFCVAIVDRFGPEFLRGPTTAEMKRIVEHNTSFGWIGQFGSLDCSHWTWKNCPYGWQGTVVECGSTTVTHFILGLGLFQDRKGHRSIIMEALADYSYRIWSAFVGLPGSNNDINVFDRFVRSLKLLHVRINFSSVLAFLILDSFFF
jgi:hypothetical protein